MAENNKGSNSKEDSNTKWFRKRDLIEWAVILTTITILYATGLHTEVLGRIQQVVLWTGLIQPEMEIAETEQEPADLDMELVSLEGKSVNLADFRGKVIFLNYWATWCPPCIAEMPNIQALYDEYSQNDQIRFVMVSRDEEPEKARSFLERKEYSLPAYRLVGPRPQNLQSSILPTTIVINKEGKIVVKEKGMANYNTRNFRNFLDSLINN